MSIFTNPEEYFLTDSPHAVTSLAVIDWFYIECCIRGPFVVEKKTRLFALVICFFCRSELEFCSNCSAYCNIVRAG